MTSVPSWIGKAVIVQPADYGKPPSVTPITHWRATATQVIVQTGPGGGDLRFHLDTLTRIGEPRWFPRTREHLADPNSDEVVYIRYAQIVDEARRIALRAIEEQRGSLRQETDDPQELAESLTAIQDAVSEALALLAPVL